MPHRKPFPSRILNDTIQLVENSHENYTPVSLGKSISKHYNLKTRDARAIIQQLISSGHLRFSDQHGRTVVEKSYDIPVRISPHVILKPPGMNFTTEKDDVVVNISPGASFGNGRHPSSRLAVRAIEYLLTETVLFPLEEETVLLDIGTGTGILAITALKFGITRGVGIDVDPCARREAAENAKQNELDDRFQIQDVDIADIQTGFHLILANLRLPTLSRLFKRLNTLLHQPGAMVLSGIRTHEADTLLCAGATHKLDCIWRAAEKNWSSLILHKPPSE